MADRRKCTNVKQGLELEAQRKMIRANFVVGRSNRRIATEIFGPDSVENRNMGAPNNRKIRRHQNLIDNRPRTVRVNF